MGKGYNCRKDIRNKILNGLDDGLDGLVGNLIDDVLRGKLVTGLLKAVGDLVGGLLGAVLGNLNACTPTGLLGAPIFVSGTEAGCVAQVDETLEEIRDANVDKNGSVPAALKLVTELVHEPLDELGNVLENVLESLGLETNRVRTELISLDCNKAARLVY